MTDRTRFDPTKLYNGSLINSGFTLTSDSYGYGLTNNAATSKQTFEVVGFNFILSSGIAFNDGVYLDYDGTNWTVRSCYDNSTIYTGPTTPTPNFGVDRVTVDLDPQGQKLSVRVNGELIFDNVDISGSMNTPDDEENAAFWFVGSYALSAEFGALYGFPEVQSTLYFSNLTYEPLEGYQEWDAALGIHELYGYLERNNLKRYFEVTVTDNGSASNTCVGIIDVADTENFVLLNQNGEIYPEIVSDASKYLAYVSVVSPYVLIYDWTTGSPVKISDPSILPSGGGTSCAWSPNGRYLAVTSSSSPYILFYDFNSGSPVKISDPATLPAAIANHCSWSPDGRYLVVGHYTSPYITIYDWTTGSPVKVSDPSTLPLNTVNGTCWSPDGLYMIAVFSSEPYIRIYNWTTGSPVISSAPTTLPTGGGYGCSWSPDGKYLVINHGTSPFITIYDWTTGSPVKISNPSTLPGALTLRSAWSPNSRYLAVVMNSSQLLLIYDFNSGSPVKISDPATMPAYSVRDCSWSADGKYLAICGNVDSPYSIIYDWSTGSPVKTTDVDVPPTDSTYGCSWGQKLPLSGPSFTSNNTVTIAVNFDDLEVFFNVDGTPNITATGIFITEDTSYVPFVKTDTANVSVTINQGDEE